MTSAAPKTSVLAVVALVLSIACAPVGLILGIIALVRINNSEGALGGKNLAIASLVIAGVFPFIFGMLSAIAIPNFIRYKIRSQQSEARAMLMSIRTGQEQFFVENGVYLSAGPTSGGDTQKKAWTEPPCDERCGREDLSMCTSFSCIAEPFGPLYFSYACVATAGDKPDFTCAAVGDLDGDGDKSAFVYGTNHEGRTNLVAPLPAIAVQAGCTGDEPADQVVDCKPGVF